MSSLIFVFGVCQGDKHPRMGYWSKFSASPNKPMQDPGEHLSGILFGCGLNRPLIVTVPHQNGILGLDQWIYKTSDLNFYVTRSKSSIIGVKHLTFKRFPMTRRVMLNNMYTVFYWTQDLKMPINRALLKYCVGAADHKLLHGNVMVLKHRQSSSDKYEDMTTEDIALVASIVGCTVVGDMLNCVDEFDMALNGGEA
ncbi:hypothetical protein OG21DRAFT_1519653 [Imleria badia]|nr:hypothetical protein OG21DRAFT_1519653 [Imleria badia]